MELDGEDLVTKHNLYTEDFELGNELLTVALSASKAGVVEGATPEGPRFSALTVILGLFAKAVKTFRSIHLLCERGYCEDANGLLRTLAEVMTTVTYIAKEDSEERAQQYFDFMSMQDRKLKNATEGNPGLRGFFDQQAIDKIDKMEQKTRARLTDEEYDRRRKRGCWYPDGTIEALMRVTGLQSVYDLPFRVSSRAVHATDLMDHVSIRADGALVIKPLPGDYWTGAVLGTANAFFCSIIAEASAFAKLGVEEQIAKIQRKLVPDAE